MNQELFEAQRIYDLTDVSIVIEDYSERILENYEIPNRWWIGCFYDNLYGITAAHNVLTYADPEAQHREVVEIRNSNSQIKYKIHNQEHTTMLKDGDFLCEKKNWQDIFLFKIQSNYNSKNTKRVVNIKKIREMIKNRNVYVSIPNTSQKAKVLKIDSYKWEKHYMNQKQKTYLFYLTIKNQIFYEPITKEGDGGKIVSVIVDDDLFPIGIHLGKHKNQSHCSPIPSSIENIHYDLHEDLDIE